MENEYPRNMAGQAACHVYTEENEEKEKREHELDEFTDRLTRQVLRNVVREEKERRRIIAMEVAEFTEGLIDQVLNNVLQREEEVRRRFERDLDEFADALTGQVLSDVVMEETERQRIIAMEVADDMGHQVTHTVLSEARERNERCEREVDEFADHKTDKVTHSTLTEENPMNQMREQELDELAVDLTGQVLSGVVVKETERQRIIAMEAVGFTERLVDQILNAVLQRVKEATRCFERDLDEFADHISLEVTRTMLSEARERNERCEREVDDKIKDLTDWLLQRVTNYSRRDYQLRLTDGGELTRDHSSESLLLCRSPSLDPNKWICPFNKITKVYSNDAYNESPNWGSRMVVCNPNLERKFGDTNLLIRYNDEKNTEENCQTSDLSGGEPSQVRRKVSKLRRFFGRLLKPRRQKNINGVENGETTKERKKTPIVFGEVPNDSDSDEEDTNAIKPVRRSRNVFRRFFGCACFGGGDQTLNRA